MKIHIEHNGNKITMETSSEHIDDVMDDIKRCLIAIGFHPETLTEYFDTD